MIDRRSVFAAAAGALALAATATPAWADATAEQYIASNANVAITTLSDRSVPATTRAQRFRDLMVRLADVPSISNYVLGAAAARQLRTDPALASEWQAAFLDYCVAVYEDQLSAYRGNNFSVLGSTDMTAGSDVVVKTQITPTGSRTPQPVNWRVKKRGAAWRVVDVSLVVDRNPIWLAQQQRLEFQQVLGARSDVRALITRLREQTATMRARINAREARR